MASTLREFIGDNRRLFCESSLAPGPPAAGGLRAGSDGPHCDFSSRVRAIAGTPPFPLASVSYENASNAKGERYVWLDPKVVEHLRALRGPGENFSDVILRLAGG
jgi:hypothetical protein